MLRALAVALLLAPAGLSAQRVERGQPAAPDAAIRLYVPGGTLRVEGWARDSIAVTGTLGDNASVFGGGDRSAIKVGIEARARDERALPSAQLVVRVPRRARVWIKMVAGDIAISGLTQQVEAYTIRGRLSARQVAGVVSLEAIDATIAVAHATGDVRIRGGGGAVALEHVSGTVSVSTVDGGVTLARSSADGRIETIGGTIAVDGARPGGRLELQSHSGTVRLAIDRTRRPYLDLTSRQGRVPSTVPTGDRANGEIVARAFRGDVIVVPRAPE